VSAELQVAAPVLTHRVSSRAGQRARIIELLDRLEGRNLSPRDLAEANEAVEGARLLGDHDLLARALIFCSGVHRSAGDCDEAVKTGSEAIRLFAAMGDRRGEGQAIYRVGAALWYGRRMTEALVQLERAEAIAIEFNDQERRIRCLNMIGVVVAYLGNYARCLATYDEALSLCADERYEVERLLLLNNKAQTFLDRARAASEREDAVRHAKSAYDIMFPEAMALIERRAPSYRRAIRDTFAQCHVLRGTAADAKVLFEENRRMAELEGDEIGEVNSRLGLGEALLELDMLDQSVEILTEIRDNYSARLAPDTLARMQLALSKGLRKLGFFEKALEIFTQYHQLRNFINNDIVEQHTRHMALTLELERSKAETNAYKQLAEDLRVAQMKAEEASRAKSEFFSNMSHELRTPLNAIIGFSEIMRNQMFGALAPRYGSYVDDIFRSGQHLLELINQLLDMSKADAGKLELVEEVISLNEVVLDALMLVREAAQVGGIMLREPPPSAIRIRADLLRIKQCLINLLSNAVKFTPVGGTVSIDIVSDASEVRISVSDTGAGMAPEDVPKAFERFGQGGNARAVTGTGLGLPLTKQLIELHGGTVELMSTRGVGTTVILSLPAERIVAAAD
jgi:signal transduction histidine kinase